MKKFFATILTFSVLFAMTAMPAFAAESIVTSAEAFSVATDDGIQPREVKELLRFQTAGGEGEILIGTITPSAGSNLKVIAISPRQQTVILKQNGSVVKRLNVQSTSATQYNFYNNCNGGTYQVYLYQGGLNNNSLIGVFQTDYI